MGRLKPEKLHVTYLNGISSENLVLPRLYTLTHSDRTGDLYLSIGQKYNSKQISGLYTRLMRDEVLAELAKEEGGLVLRAYCHVSGGFIFGNARWRYNIFHAELPLVLEAIRYGDRYLFAKNPQLDKSPVFIHFQSTNNRFNKVENWGMIGKFDVTVE
jgi:hypothetical protein